MAFWLSTAATVGLETLYFADASVRSYGDTLLSLEVQEAICTFFFTFRKYCVIPTGATEAELFIMACN